MARKLGSAVAVTVLVLGVGLLPAQEATHATRPLVCVYRDGEHATYHMTASNKDVHRDLHYEADVASTVKKNSNGIYVEDFEWTALVTNQQPTPIPKGSDAIHQLLSRDPAFALSVPDLSKVPPMLIGPITDLLTFYVDLQLAVRDSKLSKAGDHFLFEYGKPASWADGAAVCVGEDSLDFDVSLVAIDAAKGIATTVVKHVPPSKPQIRKLADWTAVAVADTPNNWIQVVKLGPDSYLGQVGKETFEVRLETRLADGHLVSATLENFVDVLERTSKSQDLSNPGEGTRYRIVRKIELRETVAPTPPGK